MNTQYAVDILLACITALTAVTTTVMNLLFSRRQKLLGDKEKEQLELMKEHSALCGGLRTLLWIHLDRIYKDSMSDGFISVEDLHTAETIYNSYHSLGGNSTGTTVYKKLRNMLNSKVSVHKKNNNSEDVDGNYKLYN